MKLSSLYQQLVNAIIRPPRAEYDISDLGNPEFVFAGKKFTREDFQLINPRGHKLQCSYYSPVIRPKKLPCVIYCHGNCGSRLDAIEAIKCLLPLNIPVVAFDFSGSGLSEGEFVSLGYYEKDDLDCVVKHLRESGRVTRIGLWGRSMGAVTAILYAATDPSIACMILDSPFSNLKVLAMELVAKLETKIPKIVTKIGFKMIQKSVEKTAKWDISKLDPLKAVEICFSPALFAHAEGDNFIDPSHSKKLYEKYSGDKNIIFFEGDHNSRRPQFFFDSVSIFCKNHLLVEDDFKEDNPLPKELDRNRFFLGEIENTEVNLSDFDFTDAFENPQQMADWLFSNVDGNILDIDDSEDEQLRQAIELSLQGMHVSDEMNNDSQSRM
jgi:cephalosporin-C deacetylase-like acetyl esterase